VFDHIQMWQEFNWCRYSLQLTGAAKRCTAQGIPMSKMKD